MMVCVLCVSGQTSGLALSLCRLPFLQEEAESLQPRSRLNPASPASPPPLAPPLRGPTPASGVSPRPALSLLPHPHPPTLLRL